MNISVGLALAGVILLARSIKLTSKFCSALEIPVEFIEKNVKLRGRVNNITEKGLEVEHIPIHLPLISALHRKTPSHGDLLIRLAGVEPTADGRLWLKEKLKPSQMIWFRLIRREHSALDCLILINQGGLFSVCLNEELLNLGLGRTAPIEGLHYSSKLYWKLHKRLLQAEMKAQKKGRGIWKESTYWDFFVSDSFKRFAVVQQLKKFFAWIKLQIQK
ncbi:protein C3orf33 homolog isoform X2 [Protopterus annectens]|uniref:protein C3orf33 homolog isoform X2 n=1 Tax=Protopterus annectens TaxID=7888 RepID=UPI001CFA827E|nr:protein C3orf33 homolog isoform X2 [Protopterus annectens]